MYNQIIICFKYNDMMIMYSKDNDYVKLNFIDSEKGITGLEEDKDYWANNTIIKLNNINY